MTITTLPVAPIEAPASGDRFSVPAHHFRVAVEAGLRAVDIRTQDRRSAGGAIHGALALDPDIILMDEPASALDPIATARVEELIDFVTVG